MSLEINHTNNQTELIRLCQKNDQKSFEQLYRLYSKAMFNVCMRLLNNTQEAEDALQKSFILAFKNISSYKEKSNFGSWLKRIVINKCIDLLRKRNKDLLSLDLISDVTEENDSETEIDYSIESIRLAFKLLPDGYRLILNLYLFEEFTHAQIAKKLNISEGTSKSQYMRGKKKLVQLIQLNAPSHER